MTTKHRCALHQDCIEHPDLAEACWEEQHQRAIKRQEQWHEQWQERRADVHRVWRRHAERQDNISNRARIALGLGIKYPPTQTAEGTLPDGRPVRLIAQRRLSRNPSTHRLQILCDSCNQWVPAGRLSAHQGSSSCYAARNRHRATRDPTMKTRRDPDRAALISRRAAVARHLRREYGKSAEATAGLLQKYDELVRKHLKAKYSAAKSAMLIAKEAAGYPADPKGTRRDPASVIKRFPSREAALRFANTNLGFEYRMVDSGHGRVRVQGPDKRYTLVWPTSANDPSGPRQISKKPLHNWMYSEHKKVWQSYGPSHHDWWDANRQEDALRKMFYAIPSHHFATSSARPKGAPRIVSGRDTSKSRSRRAHLHLVDKHTGNSYEEILRGLKTYQLKMMLRTLDSEAEKRLVRVELRRRGAL